MLIDRFLRERLSLNLHPNKIYLQPTTHSVRFLGQVLRGNRCFPATRTTHNARTDLRALSRRYCNASTAHRPAILRKIMVRLNSHLGILQHTHTFYLRRAAVGYLDSAVLRRLTLPPDLSHCRIRIP